MSKLSKICGNLWNVAKVRVRDFVIEYKILNRTIDFILGIFLGFCYVTFVAVLMPYIFDKLNLSAEVIKWGGIVYSVAAAIIVSILTFVFSSRGLVLNILQDVAVFTAGAIHIVTADKQSEIFHITWTKAVNLFIVFILAKFITKAIYELIICIKSKSLKSYKVYQGLPLADTAATFFSSVAYGGLYTFLVSLSDVKGHEVTAITVMTVFFFAIYYCAISQKFLQGLIVFILNTFGVLIGTSMYYTNYDALTEKMRMLVMLCILLHWMIWGCMKLAQVTLVEDELKNFENSKI